MTLISICSTESGRLKFKMKALITAAKFFICGILFLFCACEDQLGSSYYISVTGNDNNKGTIRHPWMSIERANRQRFKAGDCIFLKGGESFRGCLILKNDSGLKEKPVIITSYGKGKAEIFGGTGNAVVISECKNLEISNLKTTGSGRKSNQNGNGIEIFGSSHITIHGIETSGFQNAGLWINGCDHITLSEVHAFSNGFTGIGTDYRHWNYQIQIRDCIVENNPGHPGIRDNHSGSGILLASVKNGLVERCEACYNGWDMPRAGNGPVGIWTWNSDSVVIQHCLSHHNKSPDMDGGGFDFDGGVTNSVLQYNFSHHNSGAGYLVCQFAGAERELADNTLRFNISLDDGLGCHFAGIMIYAGGEKFKSTCFYNNTIVNTFHSAINFDGIPAYLENPPELCFFNNVFISGKEQILNLNLVPGTILSGNLYWAYGDGGFSVEEYRNFGEWVQNSGYEKQGDHISGWFTDPLIDMNFSSLPESTAGLSQLTLFSPVKGSSLRGNGIIIPGDYVKSAGMKDFNGKEVLIDERLIGALK